MARSDRVDRLHADDRGGRHCPGVRSRAGRIVGCCTAVLGWAAALVGPPGWTPSAHAQTIIPIPNGSFESPSAPTEIPYATEQVDAWQKTPEPAGYDPEAGQGPWAQKSGVFLNIPAPQSIENLDGAQAAFLFSYPGVGFFQDYDSVGGTNTIPTHEFGATFSVGRSYRLTAGFTTSSFSPLTEGATLRMRLYYRSAGTNRVSVAETTVTYSTNTFADPFRLLDYTVTVPKVESAQAWAGQRIGVEVVSTVSTNLQGGVWDVDNVRLIEFVSPTLTQPRWEDGRFEAVLLSDAGAVLELLTSTNLSLPVPGWASQGVFTNTSGLTNIIDAAAVAGRRFYAVRQ